ncbi:hypothetical protein [Thioalkalivibrio sp. ALM2T]|uniref:hypothetical protein n=1 Tax=Thioalkalivibrio sp. ALM2T TaxID=1158184 RepID=UPI00039BB7AE|nr:hypothetical protein [Thioalkalivibrio sp. ALM2T]
MEHILNQLILPDRYERLRDHLGDDVANLLVQPSDSNVQTLRMLSDEIKTRKEGVLVPLSGQTGVGKTTFAMNATQWVPGEFTQSLHYDKDLDFESLSHAVKQFSKSLPADNARIIPINIDHRENNPPNDAELAAIKRFLRTNSAGVPVLLFWPETDPQTAEDLSARYEGIAGEASVNLPVVCEGPARDTWRDIARHTLMLCNDLPHLEELGVDPADYEPSKFSSLGDFLRTISRDFNKQVQRLRSEFERPVSVVIVFVSESAEPGVLTQITSSAKYGLLDAHSLISVTPQSVIGKWWAQRRGLLTRTIVQLSASALCLPPAAAASSVRNFSGDMPLFDESGYRKYGPARGVRDLLRSDLGKFLTKASMSRFEARGTPGNEATAAFQLLAESGFNLGKDKNLNSVMAAGIGHLLSDSEIPYEDVTAEAKLPFCPLIPDNAVYFERRVQCVEYTWRKGNFLSSNYRSTVAQYILSKLKNYARELGWVND